MLIVCLIQFCFDAPPSSMAAEVLRSNDVVCLVGGANVVAGQEHGYLETLVRLSFPSLDLRFRSLAHEGDTVFAQPRDYNYPSLAKQLEQTGATVVLAYFGQTEALDGPKKLPQFVANYERLIDQLGPTHRRVVLISPMPFEAPAPPLSDLSLRNSELQQYVQAIKELASKRGLAFIALFSGRRRNSAVGEHFTNDGIHLKAQGHWNYDLIVARELGAKADASAVRVDSGSGTLSRSEWERVRQTVIEKNRLWFAYSRPMNWAFLGGDRVDQPSSRDHVNPKIRWFPEEMQRFGPLIEEQEKQIAKLAGAKPFSRQERSQ